VLACSLEVARDAKLSYIRLVKKPNNKKKVLWLSGLSEVLLILSTEVQTLLRPIKLVLFYAGV
jgi:hypothetical protein